MVDNLKILEKEDKNKAKKMNRRKFLKTLLQAGVAATLPINELARLTTTFYSIPKNPQLYSGITIDYNNKIVNVNANGCSIAELYDYLKKIWENEPSDVSFPIVKMETDTPNMIEMKGGFKISANSMEFLNDGAIIQRVDGEKEIYSSIISLNRDK